MVYCAVPQIFVFFFRVSHSSQLVVPFTKTAAYFNSFFVSTTRLWNSLSANYVRQDSVRQFRKCIKILSFALKLLLLSYSFSAFYFVTP